MTYKVIKNIPVPPPKVVPNKYPFNAMEVGDSFYVPDVDVTNINSLRQSCYYHARRYGAKFRVINEGKGFRVFKIK